MCSLQWRMVVWNSGPFLHDYPPMQGRAIGDDDLRGGREDRDPRGPSHPVLRVKAAKLDEGLEKKSIGDIRGGRGVPHRGRNGLVETNDLGGSVAVAQRDPVGVCCPREGFLHEVASTP